MEIKCQKCGALASDDQAFCSKCGAVLGMSDAGRPQREAPPNLAATVVGKFPFPPPPSRPPANQPPPPPPVAPTPRAPAVATTPAQPPARAPLPASIAPAPAAPPSRSNATLLIIIGFVVVLLIGGLLIFLFLFNLQR